jgi:hypothetical protein
LNALIALLPWLSTATQRTSFVVPAGTVDPLAGEHQQAGRPEEGVEPALNKQAIGPSTASVAVAV